ncbi:hypothetical protein WJ437_08975 [Ignavigranum ruoffiae]|uniref:hypothetical protein n=1 Tax=Ignavigranum ruoffiae TaxID=89093 RepID=UPI003B00A400
MTGETGDYSDAKGESVNVPCFANYVSQQRVFELYGDRTDRVLIARFMQAQHPFDKALFQGKSFIPIEQTDAPKTAYRLKEVAE